MNDRKKHTFCWKCYTSFCFQEQLLVDYSIKAFQIYYGLASIELLRFVFRYAAENDIVCPPMWTRNEITGVDWFNKFMKRTDVLSIRTPEATRLSRATSFNKANNNHFVDNLSTVLEQYKFPSHFNWHRS